MRRWVLVVVVLVCAAACDSGHVRADQTVVISGRALSATGAPLADAPVQLFKEPDGIRFGATTDAAGRYRFRVKGSDTQGSSGDPERMAVVIARPSGAPPTGDSTTLQFTVRHGVLRLPTMRLWHAALRAAPTTTGAPVIRMSWRVLRGAKPSYTAELLDGTRGTTLWTQPASGSRARIDARVLEDHSAVAAVAARTDLGHGVHAIYLSGSAPVRPPAGAPPSRHEPCYALTGENPPLERFRQPVCGATDGVLESPARLVAGNGKVVTGVLLDLVGQTRLMSLITAAGVTGTVVVEISSDSHVWTRVATATGPRIAVRPPGEPLARYVRVRSPSGADESALAELSVW